MSYLLNGSAPSLIPIMGKLRCTWCCQSCSRRTQKRASSQVLPGSASTSRGGPREVDVSRLRWLPVFPGEGSFPGVSSRDQARPQEVAVLPRRVARRAALAEAAATRGGRLWFLHYPDHALNAGDDDDSPGKSLRPVRWIPGSRRRLRSEASPGWLPGGPPPRESSDARKQTRISRRLRARQL